MIRKLLLTFIVAIFTASLYAQPAGYNYNTEIYVSNSTGTPVYNYQMPIIINTKALINAGQMKADGSDVLFGTPCTGTKLFNYFLDTGINTTGTRFWVLIDTLQPNSTLDLYMFYGNPAATSASTITIFNGPFNTANQATAAISNSFTTAGEEEGIFFTVNQTLFVSALGKDEPSGGTRNVNLFNNATSALIATTTVAGPANQFEYNQLVKPISLSPGIQYSLMIFFPSGSSYNNGIFAPSFNSAINFLGTASDFSGNTFAPASSFYNGTFYYFGYPDMQFYTATSLSSPPTYALGTQNSPGFSTQPVANLNICPNGNGTLTAQSQGAAATYVWQVNTGSGWTNLSNNSNYAGVSTSTLSLIGIPPSMNGYQYRANVSSSCGSGLSNVSTLSVPATFTAPFATLFGPNPACQYINSLYGVYTNINHATYQWSLNGAVVSTDSIYAFHPVNGDQLYCVLTAPSNGALGCYSAPEAVTNQITLTTGTNLQPHDSIATNINDVCTSTQANFRCYTDVMGGSFQWMVNGNNVGANSATYAYVPVDGDQVTCVITTPANGCYSLTTATSQPVVMSVISNINPIISITATANYNPGDIVTVYSNVLNAGNDYKIAWSVNGQPADTTHNIPTYQYIKGGGQDQVYAILIPLSTPAMGTCYNAVASNHITIGTATSVGTVTTAGSIQVYPNPFSEEISADGLQQGDQVCIYDVMGKRVSQVWSANSNDKQTFSIKNLVPGMYFLHVWSNTGNTKANISIQKL